MAQPSPSYPEFLAAWHTVVPASLVASSQPATVLVPRPRLSIDDATGEEWNQATAAFYARRRRHA